MKKSKLMVQGFFRAQIRLGKIMKKKKRNKTSSKLQLCRQTISPDWNSSNQGRWINNQIDTSSSSMMISAASDDPMRNKRKRKLETGMDNEKKKKKMKLLLDNQIGSTSTSSSASDDPMLKKKKMDLNQKMMTPNHQLKKKKKKKMKLLLDNQIGSTSTSSSTSDDPMLKKKKMDLNQKMMTPNHQLKKKKKKKKMKLLLDNQIGSTSTSTSSMVISDEPMGKLKRKVEKEMDLKEEMKTSKKKKMKLLGNSSMFTTPILLRHGHRPKYINNNQTTRNPSTLSDLPPELLAEVLKRLPVKYVLRCRCIQKSWNSLIKTPTFITLHTDYHKNSHHRPKYLSFKATYSNFMTIRFDDDRQCHEYCRVKYLPDLPHCTWLAHSHGLFCVTYMSSLNPEKDGIYLWNPLVQKYTTLPPSPFFGIFERLSLLAKAFGFVPQFNDYVVVYLMRPHTKCCPPNPHLVKIAIYSLNNNSWKTVGHDYFFKGTIDMYRSVFVNGVAYWLGSKSENCQILVCFDTKTDTLREILLPDWVDTPWIGIHPFCQSIAYFVDDERAPRFEMWVLKGDSIDEFFWEKKMSIGVKELFRTEVLGLRNNGEPIVFSCYDLLSYNLDSHEASDFVDSWNCWDDFSYYDYGMGPPFSVSPFVESLALLNLD